MPLRSSVFSPVLLACALTATMAPPARTGVRVDQPGPATTSPRLDLPRRTNFQIGIGPVAAATDVIGSTRQFGTNATAALEKVVDARWTWLARFDYVRFERTESTGFGRGAGDLFLPSPQRRFQRTTITTLELATRYSPPSGTVHPYFEVGAGYARRASLQDETSPSYPQFENDFSSHADRLALDFTLGGAWQPARLPVGLFAEMRFADLPGRHDSFWLGPRAGLMALAPASW